MNNLCLSTDVCEDNLDRESQSVFFNLSKENALDVLKYKSCRIGKKSEESYLNRISYAKTRELALQTFSGL